RGQAAPSGRGTVEGFDGPAGLQADRDHRPDVLPMAERVRRPQGRPGQADEGSGKGERPAQTSGRRPSVGYGDPSGGRLGKFLSPARRRLAVEHVQQELRISERRACRVLRQPRAVQRYAPIVREDEEPLIQRIIELACVYGRYGTPRIEALLRREGRVVNHKRVERI